MVEVGGEGQIPIMLANTTIKIPRDREVGRAVSASIWEMVVSEADSGDGHTHTHTHTVVNVEEIVVPIGHKDKISKVIIENRDVVANLDKELGQTQSVWMKINTGDYPPIRLKPYQTPLHKQKLVEGAVKDILGASVIEHSVYSWGFPIVIVSKKDGGA